MCLIYGLLIRERSHYRAAKRAVLFRSHMKPHLSRYAHLYANRLFLRQVVVHLLDESPVTSLHLLRLLIPVLFFHFLCVRIKQLQRPHLDTGKLRLIRIRKLTLDPCRSNRMTVAFPAFVRL